MIYIMIYNIWYYDRLCNIQYEYLILWNTRGYMRYDNKHWKKACFTWPKIDIVIYFDQSYGVYFLDQSKTVILSNYDHVKHASFECFLSYFIWPRVLIFHSWKWPMLKWNIITFMNSTELISFDLSDIKLQQFESIFDSVMSPKQFGTS